MSAVNKSRHRSIREVAISNVDENIKQCRQDTSWKYSNIEFNFLIFIKCDCSGVFKELKMASAGLTTPDSIKEKSNRYHMVTWVNNLLKTSFKDVRHLGSGDSSV